MCLGHLFKSKREKEAEEEKRRAESNKRTEDLYQEVVKAFASDTHKDEIDSVFKQYYEKMVKENGQELIDFISRTPDFNLDRYPSAAWHGYYDKEILGKWDASGLWRVVKEIGEYSPDEYVAVKPDWFARFEINAKIKAYFDDYYGTDEETINEVESEYWRLFSELMPDSYAARSQQLVDGAMNIYFALKLDEKEHYDVRWRSNPSPSKEEEENDDDEETSSSEDPSYIAVDMERYEHGELTACWLVYQADDLSLKRQANKDFEAKFGFDFAPAGGHIDLRDDAAVDAFIERKQGDHEHVFDGRTGRLY
jgi:hypothetical protein